MLEQLDASLISSFLEYLESTRGNSAETRNIRLAAIRSFFRFLQHREPAAIGQVRRVLAIPFKKTDHRLVPYLAQEEMQALLDAPDPSTRMGVRDRAILHLALCAGLRVSELIGLRIEDVAPQSTSIRVRGKGRRERALPLWKTTVVALRAWLAIRGPVASPELFVNARDMPFSRWVSHTFCGATPKQQIEIVVHGVQGLRVPAGDSAALAAALESLVTDCHLRDQMSCAARQFFLNNFTPDKVAEAHERTYQELLHTKPMKERAQQQEAGSKSVMPG